MTERITEYGPTSVNNTVHKESFFVVTGFGHNQKDIVDTFLLQLII